MAGVRVGDTLLEKWGTFIALISSLVEKLLNVYTKYTYFLNIVQAISCRSVRD